MGLKAGQAFNRASRTAQSQFNVTGDITMEHTSGEAPTVIADSMGFWWKYALGSAFTTPTVITGTAYQQIHTYGSKAGQFLTVQVGRPQISGVTVQPFTYTGVKITDWEFSCNDNQIAQLKLTCDGQTELTSTGLAAASYPTPNGLFSFANASTMTIGGTASTSSGVTTVAAGSALGSQVTGVTITGTTPMKTRPVRPRQRRAERRADRERHPHHHRHAVDGVLLPHRAVRRVQGRYEHVPRARLHEVRLVGQRRRRRAGRREPVPAFVHFSQRQIQNWRT